MIPLSIIMIDDEDEQAFIQRLFLENERGMYAIAMRLVKEHNTACDIVSAACVKMIEKTAYLQKIDEQKQTPYILSIVKNQSCTAIALALHPYHKKGMIHMKRLISLIALFLCTTLLALPGLAEDYETAMFNAIEHWDALAQQYENQLIEEQCFVASFFTDAIQYACEDNYAMIDAINACDSLDDFVALLNNGVIDPNSPCVPEDDILASVYAVLDAAGYERPSGIFVLHLTSAGIDHWYVQCGSRTIRTYDNGDELLESVVAYKLVFSGENHQLTIFADTSIIGEISLLLRHLAN